MYKVAAKIEREVSADLAHAKYSYDGHGLTDRYYIVDVTSLNAHDRCLKDKHANPALQSR